MTSRLVKSISRPWRSISSDMIQWCCLNVVSSADGGNLALLGRTIFCTGVRCSLRLIGSSTVLGLMIKQVRTQIHIHRKYRNELTDIRNVVCTEKAVILHMLYFFVDVHEHEFPSLHRRTSGYQNS